MFYCRLYETLYFNSSVFDIASLCQFTVAAQEGPGIVIAHPGGDVELLCNVTRSGGHSVAWLINNVGPYGVNALRNGIQDGYSANGNNLIVENIMMNDSRNGSEYSCMIVNNMERIIQMSNETFLYVAGEYQYRRCELQYHTDVCMCNY